MRVFVAGGTGVVGRPLVQALVDDGHSVTVSTRRRESFELVVGLGAEPVVMNGLDEVEVHKVITAVQPEVIINQMTALSGPSQDYGAWLDVTNRLRRQGTKALMSAALTAGTRRVIAQSASFMTRPGSGLTDEQTPLYLDAPGPIGIHIAANLAAENLVLGTPGVEGVVLRYGFLYGEGTAIGPDGDIVTAIKAGELPIVGDGTGHYPFIHVRDAVSVTLQAVDRGDPGVYNVVDDDPAAQADWLPYLAGILNAPPPPRISVAEAGEQIGVQAVYYGSQLAPASNAKSKALLGLVPDCPSWRDGFRKLFG